MIGWGLVSFSTKAFEMMPEESVPVDVISADQLAKVTAGMKTGKKENPKPLVEKVAEAKPVDDAVGKITEKAPVVTDTSPPPQPKPMEKPVEKKPDPPKPVAEQAEGRAEADREEAGSAQGRSDRGSPEEGREEAAAEAGSQAPPSRRAAASRRGAHLRSVEDRSAARQARSDAAGRDRRHAEFQCGAWACQGQGRGQFRDLGRDVQVAGRTLLEEALWRHRSARIPEAAFDIRLKRDGTLEAMPVPEGTPATPYLRVYQESALRAIIECQPYNLPAAYFDEWKYFAPVFTERKT